jgi:SAM-dependent methyltransferase
MWTEDGREPGLWLSWPGLVASSGMESARAGSLVATGIAVAVICVGILYWLLVFSEGTFLGARVVSLLYDLTARRYDHIKQLQTIDEQIYVGAPLAYRLEGIPEPRVLDVATGTARVPLALLGSEAYEGWVAAGDRAPRMLGEAARVLGGEATPGGRVVLLRMDATQLPFVCEGFDAVTCLEALEFVPDGVAALREMHRVLRPKGTLLISNRVGTDALGFPFRLCGRGRMERALARMGFVDIETRPWQVHYDLVWATRD